MRAGPFVVVARLAIRHGWSVLEISARTRSADDLVVADTHYPQPGQRIG